MTEPITEGWVTTREAEALTGYSRPYLRQLANSDTRIVARKVGRDWLIDCASLVAFKVQMDRLGSEKHNPWRDSLTSQRHGRRQPDPEGRCIRCPYHSDIDGCGYDPDKCREAVERRKV